MNPIPLKLESGMVWKTQSKAIDFEIVNKLDLHLNCDIEMIGNKLVITIKEVK